MTGVALSASWDGCVTLFQVVELDPRSLPARVFTASSSHQACSLSNVHGSATGRPDLCTSMNGPSGTTS